MPINPISTSTNAYSSLTQAQSQVNKTGEQISTGQRINRAADDPAGLQILSGLQTDIRGNSAAIRNSLDGISAIQIADGGIGQVSDALQRIRELSIQAQNGILNSSDKAALQSEADALLAGIKDAITQTTFNNQSLLSEDGQLQLQTGSDVDATQNLQTYDLTQALQDEGLFSLDITSSDALTAIDQSQSYINRISGEIGASQNRLESRIDSLFTTNLNQAAAASVIGDSDIAQVVSERASALIQQEVGLALQAQANANRSQVLNLLSI